VCERRGGGRGRGREGGREGGEVGRREEREIEGEIERRTMGSGKNLSHESSSSTTCSAAHIWET